MSILDEDKSNFNSYSVHCAYYTEIIKRYLPDAMVVAPDCDNVACSECVGSKYNIKNGCPVCGELCIDRIGGNFDIQIDDTADSVHKCMGCGSIITSCGSGDVTAVGIATADLRTSEDII